MNSSRVCPLRLRRGTPSSSTRCSQPCCTGECREIVCAWLATAELTLLLLACSAGLPLLLPMAFLSFSITYFVDKYMCTSKAG